MQKLFLLFFVALFLPSASFAEKLPLFNRVESSRSQDLKSRFNKEVSAPQFLSINRNAVSQILNSNIETLELDVPLDASNVANLKLTEYNILTPDAVIIEESVSGRKTYPANIPFKAYKGFYNNDMNSMVIICFGENFVKGMLVTANNTYTLATLDENQLTDDCILYANDKVLLKNDFKCDTDELPVSEETKRSLQNFNPDNVTNTFLQANIAIEIDQITYNIYGQSIPNASAYTLSLMSVVSALYNRDINVKLVVPSIHVWTTTDPYNGSGSNALLNQFRNYWNANMSATPRTLAHFISRRSDNLGGIAWVNVLCNSVTSGNGYGFSNTYGTINQLPVYSWDAMVVAHEIGHNFGSNHTHNCSWPGGPIDTCYIADENAACLGGQQIRPRPGTIMSYCHLTSAGIDLKLGFGPLPKARIRQQAEVAGCMTTAPEALLLSYPQGGETFMTNTSQYIYWGTSSVSNFNIELSTNSGSSWSSIAANVPAQEHFYVWTVPYIATSAACRIRIYDASNPTIGDTVNADFTIKVQLNSIPLITPANQTVLTTTQHDTTRVTFSWNSAGTIPGINYKWKIRKGGGPYQLYTSDMNGTATSISIRKSNLDSIAVAFGLNGDSVLCAWAATGYLNNDSVTSDVRVLILKTNTVGVTNISTIVPTENRLHNNYPNPFNPVTKIKFEIPKDEFVKISVYDLSGKMITFLVNERLKAGVYETDFDGMNLSSGTYFYRIETSNFVETRKNGAIEIDFSLF